MALVDGILLTGALEAQCACSMPFRVGEDDGLQFMYHMEG